MMFFSSFFLRLKDLGNRFFLFILYALLLLAFPADLFSSTVRLDSLLMVLDKTIEEEKKYTEEKEKRILGLKQKLTQSKLDSKDKLLTYNMLFQEYEPFICDSAIHYAEIILHEAEKFRNTYWINESKLNLSRILATSGLFNEAIDLLNSMNKDGLNEEQLVQYYLNHVDTYIYWGEYTGGETGEKYAGFREAYLDSLISVLQPGTLNYAIINARRALETNRYDDAEKLLFSYLPMVKENTREFAILTSWIAYLYEFKNEQTLRKEFYVLSAVADIRASVKENVSLRNLAILILDDTDISRANRYIKKSLEDANFFNARLRNLQVSRILPVIDKAYQMEREQQQKKLRNLLVTVSILSIILLIALYLLIRQMRKLSKAQKEIMEINIQLNKLNDDLQAANKQQKQTNISLAEANHIKEQFISNFLEICTKYIGKLEAFKHTVNIKLKVGQTQDVLKLTSSTIDSARELKELYGNFDKAFLNIYPDFIEQFNQLLRNEERYPITNDNTLNQELRVFALIRLGITDSNKIATFLHYSLRTIYNYRSKVKSKALNQEEDFEEKVKILCF